MHTQLFYVTIYSSAESEITLSGRKRTRRNMGVGDLNKHREIGKYISILQRLSNIYFANELSSYQIGCGQQFFLLQIFKNPGISLQELASNGSYDKATATRAVKKLEEEAYVRTETDGEDKRVRHIYATEKAKRVVDITRNSVDTLTEVLLEGFTEEERDSAEAFLIRMADNSYRHIIANKGKE